MQFSGFGLAAVFCRWCELLKFENIVSPYFEFRFHPMKWPLIFQLLWFSQPGFSSGTWTAISSSSWDFSPFTLFDGFLQPCHLGSLGVSHHGTTGEMTKTSISSTVMRHCNIQKLWLPIPGSQPALFTTRMFFFGLQFHRTIQPTNVCTAFRFFFLKSELKIQLLFCHSIRWPCFHLSKERIENPAIQAFLPFDIVDRFFFTQSGLPSYH